MRHEGRKALLHAAENGVNIVCVGTGNLVEYEDGDRRSLRLSAAQERLIRETAAVAAHTVVVVFAGAAVDMSAWEECADAILYAGFPGMGGDAVIADILTGARLPQRQTLRIFRLQLCG